MEIPTFVCVILLLAPGAMQAQPAARSGPPGHFDGVDQRGDKGMGFRHEMTHHHFHLLPDGGSIEVEANKQNDTVSREAIREHMAGIATMFAQGNFSLPMFIHAVEPPGMKTMQRLKGKISYSAEHTQLGAQVRIKTADPEALRAIHDFLQFQIEEHRTGDKPISLGTTPCLKMQRERRDPDELVACIT